MTGKAILRGLSLVQKESENLKRKRINKDIRKEEKIRLSAEESVWTNLLNQISTSNKIVDGMNLSAREMWSFNTGSVFVYCESLYLLTDHKTYGDEIYSHLSKVRGPGPIELGRFKKGKHGVLAEELKKAFKGEWLYAGKIDDLIDIELLNNLMDLYRLGYKKFMNHIGHIY